LKSFSLALIFILLMSFKLILDFGNSYKKMALFEGTDLVEYTLTQSNEIGIIESWKQLYRGINRAILSSVVNIDIHTKNYLKENFSFVFFDQNTPIPISNNYHTPKTLGKDRLAAAVGAHFLFPGRNIMVIDAGSCITYELVSKEGAYEGGAISPGLSLRARALNKFTDFLPVVDYTDYAGLIGKDTLSCLKSGILNGAKGEINAFIQAYRNDYKDLKLVLTGGDAKYFEKSINSDIFVSSNLVLIGLNHILDFNET
jgi:type III pantothenate kinase